MFDEIYAKLKDKESALLNLMMSIGGPTLFKKLTVNEVMWGYDDPLINMINNLPDSWPLYVRSKVKAFLKKNGIELPKLSKIALFVSLFDITYVLRARGY